MVSVRVAARTVLGDAVIIWLGSEPIHLGCLDIDVLVVMVMMATVILGEDLVREGIANALSVDGGNDGNKEGEDFVHGWASRLVG
jgi:hypothetical protein